MSSDLDLPNGGASHVARDQISVSDLHSRTRQPHTEQLLRCPSCGAGAPQVLDAPADPDQGCAPIVLTAGDRFTGRCCGAPLRLDLALDEGEAVWSVVASGEPQSSTDPLPAQARAQTRWIRLALQKFVSGQSLSDIGADLTRELQGILASTFEPDRHMRRPGYFTPRRVYRLLTTRLAVGLYHPRARQAESALCQVRCRPSLRAPRYLRNSALRKLRRLSFVDATGVWQPGQGESGLIPGEDRQIICSHCRTPMRWEGGRGCGRLGCRLARRNPPQCRLTSHRSGGTLNAALAAFLRDWVLDSTNVAEACALNNLVHSHVAHAPVAAPEQTAPAGGPTPAGASGLGGSVNDFVGRWRQDRPPAAGARYHRRREERRLAQKIRSRWTVPSFTMEELNARAALAAERVRLGTVRPDHLAGIVVEMTIRARPQALPTEAEEPGHRQAWEADIQVSPAALRRLLFPGWPGGDELLDDPMEQSHRFSDVPLDGLTAPEETRLHVIALRRNRIGSRTEQQIADITGVTQARVSQILSEAGTLPQQKPSPAMLARWSAQEVRCAVRTPPVPRMRGRKRETKSGSKTFGNNLAG